MNHAALKRSWREMHATHSANPTAESRKALRIAFSRYNRSRLEIWNSQLVPSRPSSPVGALKVAALVGITEELLSEARQ